MIRANTTSQVNTAFLSQKYLSCNMHSELSTIKILIIKLLKTD